MSVRQEVVSQQRSVDQNLDDAAHEAGVAEVDQSSQPCGGVLTEAKSAMNQWSVETMLDIHRRILFKILYCSYCIGSVCVLLVHHYSFNRILCSDWLL